MLLTKKYIIRLEDQAAAFQEVQRNFLTKKFNSDVEVINFRNCQLPSLVDGEVLSRILMQTIICEYFNVR